MKEEKMNSRKNLARENSDNIAKGAEI